METEKNSLTIAGSLNVLLSKYSPTKISETYSGITTAKESFALQMEQRDSVKTLFGLAEGEKNGVQRSVDERRKNRKYMIFVIASHITSIDNFLKQDKQMTEEEVKFTATDIYDNYGMFLTFADLNIIFTRAKRGDFGKLYNKLMASDVIGWFRQYSVEKDEAVANYQRERKNEIEQAKPTTLPYEVVGTKWKDKEGGEHETVRPRLTKEFLERQRKDAEENEDVKRQERAKRADLRAFHKRCEELCQERKINYEEAYLIALSEKH